VAARRWVTSRYFDQFDKSRQDRWVFGNRLRGSYLHKFAWTTINRHQMVPGAASVDDPSLTQYWTRRRRKATLPINTTTLRLLRAEDGRCLICKGTMNAVEDRPQLPQDWEHWLATTRTAIVKTAARTGTLDEAELRLVHANCRHGNSPALLPAYPSTGLA
jgi:RNA-directed DNA polymerase